MVEKEEDEEGRAEGIRKEGRIKEGKKVRERKGGSSSLSGLAMVCYCVMLRCDR